MMPSIASRLSSSFNSFIRANSATPNSNGRITGRPPGEPRAAKTEPLIAIAKKNVESLRNSPLGNALKPFAALNKFQFRKEFAAVKDFAAKEYSEENIDCLKLIRNAHRWGLRESSFRRLADKLLDSGNIGHSQVKRLEELRSDRVFLPAKAQAVLVDVVRDLTANLSDTTRRCAKQAKEGGLELNHKAFEALIGRQTQ